MPFSNLTLYGTLAFHFHVGCAHLPVVVNCRLALRDVFPRSSKGPLRWRRWTFDFSRLSCHDLVYAECLHLLCGTVDNNHMFSSLSPPTYRLLTSTLHCPPSPGLPKRDRRCATFCVSCPSHCQASFRPLPLALKYCPFPIFFHFLLVHWRVKPLLAVAQRHIAWLRLPWRPGCWCCPTLPFAQCGTSAPSWPCLWRRRHFQGRWTVDPLWCFFFRLEKYVWSIQPYPILSKFCQGFWVSHIFWGSCCGWNLMKLDETLAMTLRPWGITSSHWAGPTKP